MFFVDDVALSLSESVAFAVALALGFGVLGEDVVPNGEHPMPNGCALSSLSLRYFCLYFFWLGFPQELY